MSECALDWCSAETDEQSAWCRFHTMRGLRDELDARRRQANAIRKIHGHCVCGPMCTQCVCGDEYPCRTLRILDDMPPPPKGPLREA